MSVAKKPLAVLGEEGFGPVAEREERFFDAELRSALAERHDFVDLHRVRARLARVAPESAIAAIVAAEVGQRDENFRRKRHDAAVPAIAEQARRFEEERHLDG